MGRLAFFILLLWSTFVFSGESPDRAMRGLEDLQPMQIEVPRSFNLHPSREGKSQFRRRPVGLPNESIHNGVGNGMGGDNYVCGGGDEAYSYGRRHGISSEFARFGSANRGTYNSTIEEDLCRTEGGCGGIEPDGNCFISSRPTYATDCYPMGRMRAWDDILYENSSDNSPTSPRNQNHPGWQGRNYINDQYGFLFGRYLINQVPCPSAEASSAPVASLMEFPHAPPVLEYYPMYFQRPFIDIPYSANHLKWGFTCGILSRREAYHENPLFRTFWAGSPDSGEGSQMDNAHLDHYKTLLGMATNRLCRTIGEGGLGEVRRPVTTADDEMRETVLPICNILKEMIDRIPGGCGDQGCSNARLWLNVLLGRLVDLRKGQTAHGTFIEYRPELGAVLLQRSTYNDCHSKRASNSHPHYNVTGGDSCTPSYGELIDGGIYEPLHGTVRGREVYFEGNSPNRRLRSREGGYVPAAGYSPVVIARLAHELIHAYYYQEREQILEGWPFVPEARNEEIRAVIGQALIYYYLCDLGFCPKSFEMQRREFVRSRTVQNDQIIDTVRGYRLVFPHECRGRNGIYLGPFCTNMFTIVRYLLPNSQEGAGGNPEIARMLAWWHANAPTVDLPAMRTVDGVESSFEYLPMRGPRTQRNIGQPTLDVGTRRFQEGMEFEGREEDE